MESWTPFKKVGAPATFKGVRGPYLTKLLLSILGSFIIFIFLSVVRPPFAITVILIPLTLFALLVIFNILKTKSKGDLNSEVKQKCRYKISVKSSPITYDFNR